MAPRFSKDELVTKARDHYKTSHWFVPNSLSTADSNLVGQLALRPDLIARKDGMEHLIYVSQRITNATFNLMKQVLFDIAQLRVFSHIVLVIEERVSKPNENKLRAMRLGIVLIRHEAASVNLTDPVLQCFHPPRNLDRVPKRYRRAVKEALQKIKTGDVCVGVLDVVQVLETALTNHGMTSNTLGAKIKQARTSGVLRGMAAEAADRVNPPRILRAHPRNHNERRNKIVNCVQEIVDDCLAVLFSLD